ncbi:hypothetical protein Tco_0466511 [Tanacetum coccineum]
MTNRSGGNGGTTAWKLINKKVSFKPKPLGNTKKNGDHIVSTTSHEVSTISSSIPTSNPYDLLSQKFDPEKYKRCRGESSLVVDDVDSEEEVEVVFYESINLLSGTRKEASTSNYMVSDV